MVGLGFTGYLSFETIGSEHETSHLEQIRTLKWAMRSLMDGFSSLKIGLK